MHTYTIVYRLGDTDYWVGGIHTQREMTDTFYDTRDGDEPSPDMQSVMDQLGLCVTDDESITLIPGEIKVFEVRLPEPPLMTEIRESL